MKREKTWREITKEHKIHLGPEALAKVKAHHEKKMCESKKKFIDEASAISYARYYANGSRFKRKNNLSPYQCPLCKLFHLTTKGAR